MPVQVQPAGSQKLMETSTKFSWEIMNFTKLTEKYYYSKPFKVGSDNWRVLLYPKGYDDTNLYLSLFLNIADSENLPQGWTRYAKYNLTVVNQRSAFLSVKCEQSHSFCANMTTSGSITIVSLAKLHNDGFLTNDTLIVEVDITAPEVVVEERWEFTSTEMLDSYFTNIEQFISGVAPTPAGGGITGSSDARIPTLDEVEDAKRSLKECLSGMFQPDMKDRLAEALSILSRAEVGLSAGQLSSIRSFWARFGDITSGFLTFEQDNVEIELQKVLKEQMFSTMKVYHQTHLHYKKSSKEKTKEQEECKRKMEEITKEQEECNRKMEEIRKEEEECKRKMEEISEKKVKLESKWETMLTACKKAKSRHDMHEKKVEDAEEKKRIAEEMMTRSTVAWSNLKAEFA